MDWNKTIIIGAQCIALAVLGALVALGHDSAVTDALLAVSGGIVTLGVVQAATRKAKE